jgi:undecaprenyl-diphosphatase
MWFLSSKEIWIPLYAAIIFYFYKGKDWRQGIFVHLATILLIVLCDQISASVCKPLFERLRPTWDPMICDLVHTVNGKRGGTFGFVSSHATNVFGLATFTSFLFKKRVFTIFIFLWAVAISYSRIYLGVHFPGDVIFGSILGIVLGIIVYKLLRRFTDVKKYEKNDTKYCLIVGCTTVLCIIFVSKYLNF